MATQKKPSIYADRGTIGSTDELDEYGVWVKSEPQDLSSASSQTHKISGVSAEASAKETTIDEDDFAIPDMEELPDFDTLQEEAEKGAALETSPVFDDPETDEEAVLPDDDFALPDIEMEDENTEDQEAGDTLDTLDSLDFQETTEELDLPPLDENIDEGIDETAIEETDETVEESPVPEESQSDDEGFTEVSMDDFIVDLSGEIETPQELDMPEEIEASEEIIEAPEEPEPASPAPVNVNIENRNSSNDLSNQLLMKIAEELSSIRNELSSLKKDFTGLKAAASDSEAAEGGFFSEEDDEKIALTGDELNNILNTADFTEEAGADATVELDDLILEEAEDNSSEPFQEIKKPAKAPEPEAEEESEAITLDDLDSPLELDGSDELILESSELTESETNTDTFEELTLDDSSDETLTIEAAEESLPDLAAEETEELKQIREDGVAPMTFAPAPEDSEYLLNDPLAEEPLVQEVSDQEPLVEEAASVETEEAEDFTGETIDLSEAVIDEPDLSSEVQDNPLEEPSLEDISIDLDLSELSSEEIGSEETNSEEISSEELSADESIPEEIVLDEPAPAETEEVPELPEAIALPDDELEMPIEMPDLDILEETEVDLSADVDISSDDDTAEEIPLALETEGAEEGGDLSLIPEGFVVEAEGSDSSEISAEDIPSLPEEDQNILEEIEEFKEFEEIEEPIEAAEPEEFEPAEEAEEAAGVPVLNEANEEAAVQEKTPEGSLGIPAPLKQELKTVLSYMDQLLESLPDNKIEEFAKSEYYDTYKKLFKELGLV